MEQQSDDNKTDVLISQFKKGLYEHYKGNQYQVLDLVRHSETEEWLVLYQPCYGDKGLWVRPIEMFFESIINQQGDSVERFRFIESK